jgi:hypothetical protein
MVAKMFHKSLFQNVRIFVAISLTAICIFMVMWQRESTEMLLAANDSQVEGNFISDRFFYKDEYARQRDLGQLEVAGGSWEIRHKLRWAYKSVEVAAYKAVQSNFPKRYLRYAALLHYVGVFILTYLICLLILRHETGQLEMPHILVSGLAFVGFISAIFHVAAWQEDYTAIEMLAIAFAIHAGQKGNLWLFLVAVALAVSNRETGLAAALIFPLMNPERRQNWIYPVVFAIGLFCTLNLDLLVQPELYILDNFVVTSDIKAEYATIMNFLELPVSKWGAGILSYLAFVGPIFLLARECWKTVNGRRYFGIVAIYLFIFLFGSSLTNAFLFLMLLPVYFLIFGNALSKKDSVRGTVIPPE